MRGQVLGRLWEPATVGQHVAHGDGRLPMLAELRPVRGHWVVPRELAPLLEQVETGGR